MDREFILILGSVFLLLLPLFFLRCSLLASPREKPWKVSATSAGAMRLLRIAVPSARTSCSPRPFSPTSTFSFSFFFSPSLTLSHSPLPVSDRLRSRLPIGCKEEGTLPHYWPLYTASCCFHGIWEINWLEDIQRRPNQLAVWHHVNSSRKLVDFYITAEQTCAIWDFTCNIRQTFVIYFL